MSSYIEIGTVDTLYYAQFFLKKLTTCSYYYLDIYCFLS